MNVHFSVTKSSLFVSIVFILERNGFIALDHALVYFGVVLFFIYFRMLAIFGLKYRLVFPQSFPHSKLRKLLKLSLCAFCSDPFAPAENLFCSIFMGGWWDAMLEAFKTPSAVEGSSSKTNASKKSDKKNE